MATGLCKNFSDVANIRRFVSYTTMWHRRQVGAVCLQNDSVLGNAHSNVQSIGLLKRDRSAESKAIAPGRRFIRLFHRPAKAVKNRTNASLALLLQNVQNTSLRSSTMDHQRQVVIEGHLNVRSEQPLLQILRGVVPKEIQTGLAHCHHVGVRKKSFERGKILGRIRHIVWVNTHRREDPLVVTRQIDRTAASLQVRPHIDDSADARREGPLDRPGPIVIELRKTKVRVRIDKHAGQLTRAPAGRSLSGVKSPSCPSADAANSMPWDSTPRIVAGSRFATTTILLPTSASAS